MITLSFMIIRLLWPNYFRKRIEYLWQEAYTVNSGQQVKVKITQLYLFGTPWTIQSMEFSRPGYWSG